MNDQPPPREPLTIDIGLREPLTFISPEAARTFLAAQRAEWEWISSAPANVPAYEGLRGALNKHFARVQGAIDTWQNDDSNRAGLSQQFADLFVGLHLPLAGSAEAAIIRSLLEKEGPETAASALAARTGRLNLSTQPVPAKIWRGAVAGVAPSGHDDVADHVSRDMQSAAASLVAIVANSTARAEEHEKLFQRRMEEINSHFSALEGRITSEFKSASDAAISSIRATDAAYSSQMQLQAAVNYWDDRRKKQNASANRYLAILLIYTGLVVVAGAVAAVCYLPFLITQPIEKHTSLYAVSLTIVLICSTIAFWIGRVLLRLYLSAHHLRNDADERVVLVKTFLALVKDNKLEEKDRPLVLAPVFRSSADGIVRDEGAPETSVGSLLAKALDPKR